MKTPRISICGWQEPFAHEKGIAVVFDIFRCSTTIQCLYNLKPERLWIAPSLKQIRAEAPERVREYRIFSELSEPVDCLERFDNSPKQALETVAGAKDCLVATTTGTPAMFAARNFEEVLVGSLVGFSALIARLASDTRSITLIPAALPLMNHVEDGIVAQAVATALEGYYTHKNFVDGCALQAREQIIASGRPAYLTEKLATGAEDTRVSMHIDRYNSVPKISFTDHPLFARVV